MELDRLHHAQVMVAPNGARLTHADHPAVPVTATEVLEAVTAAADAGAQAVHLHVRDESQRHVLDADLYRKSIAVLRQSLGADFPIQITTEAVGRYSQADQIDLVKAVRPEFVSVALVEMAGEESLLHDAADFYQWCETEQVAVQHILYSARELQQFAQLQQRGIIPQGHHAVLFVLGRYTRNQVSDSRMLDEFLATRQVVDPGHRLQWMICAFGQAESECLAYAASLGGHIRVGFENNTRNEDGSVAPDNAERVRLVCEKINSTGTLPGKRMVAGAQTESSLPLTRRVLGAS